MSEIDEIKRRYAWRDAATAASARKLLDQFTFLAMQERQRALLDAFRCRFPDRDPRSLTGLDVGCGGGGTLRQLFDFGFEPENIVGVELTSHRAAEARRRLPEAVRIIEGDATTVDLPNASFDVVQQWTVYTSNSRRRGPGGPGSAHVGATSSGWNYRVVRFHLRQPQQQGRARRLSRSSPHVVS